MIQQNVSLHYYIGLILKISKKMSFSNLFKNPLNNKMIGYKSFKSAFKSFVFITLISNLSICSHNIFDEHQIFNI
jgi:hypothetical protein